MARYFNTTGPCIPTEHYMIDPEARCPGVMGLIDQKHFFVIHAPRQSGKTTLLKSLARTINAGQRCHALYCSLESAQGIHERSRGMNAIVSSLEFALKYHPGLRSAIAGYVSANNENTVIRAFLTDLAARADRPVIVFFDEADCLGGETLISFLRQLRDGYVNRGEIPFIHSLSLVGMRNIRDYKAQVRPDSLTLDSASPFNISVKSLSLANFARQEVEALYGQHTQDTGQVFPAELVDLVSKMTQGQPWLVNAIAREMIVEIGENDFKRPLNAFMAEEAAQRIILRRDTHIDSLLERLQEERVRKILEPILAGEGESIQRASNDFEFVRDLGLIREDQGVLRIANPIYNEVIARTLNADIQSSLPAELIERWMDDTTIEMTCLLKEFQLFWRDNIDVWSDRIQYKEIVPHLVLMAFLQRVVNGGAKIDREFATGSRRVDICVHYAGKRYPIELKLVRDAKTREQGLAQLGRYMDTLGAKEGWLILFDLQSQLPWERRLYWDTIQCDSGSIHLVGA